MARNDRRFDGELRMVIVTETSYILVANHLWIGNASRNDRFIFAELPKVFKPIFSQNFTNYFLKISLPLF